MSIKQFRILIIIIPIIIIIPTVIFILIFGNRAINAVKTTHLASAGVNDLTYMILVGFGGVFLLATIYYIMIHTIKIKQ